MSAESHGRCVSNIPDSHPTKPSLPPPFSRFRSRDSLRLCGALPCERISVDKPCTVVSRAALSAWAAAGDALLMGAAPADTLLEPRNCEEISATACSCAEAGFVPLPAILAGLFAEIDDRLGVAEYTRPYFEAFVEQREHIVGCVCASRAIYTF